MEGRIMGRVAPESVRRTCVPVVAFRPLAQEQPQNSHNGSNSTEQKTKQALDHVHASCRCQATPRFTRYGDTDFYEGQRVRPSRARTARVCALGSAVRPG